MAGAGGVKISNTQLQAVVIGLLQHTSSIVNCCTSLTNGLVKRLQIRIQPGLVFVTLMVQ